MKYTLPFKLNCPILFYPYKAHTTQPRSIKSPPSSTHMCSLIMSVITHNMPSLSIPVMAGLGRVEQQAHIAPRWTSSYSTERLAPPQRLTSITQPYMLITSTIAYITPTSSPLAGNNNQLYHLL